MWVRRSINEALDLVEHGRVGHVVVAPVDPAGGDDPEGRLAGSHGADLDRARVGAQEEGLALGVARLEVESVLHLPRRMLGRDVERLEIVPVVLDVRAFGDREAHVGEDRDDLLGDLRDRVDPSLRPLAGGQGDIGTLAGEPRLEGRSPRAPPGARRSPPRSRA
jgi:hypothetical protein